MKAGSTCPPLARKTALTTAASIEGKASFKVFSACCSGANGRGGLGGGASSAAPEVGFSVATADFRGEDGVSAVSSSKSKAFAVVGDSGRASGFCCCLVGAYFDFSSLIKPTGFSDSDITTNMDASGVRQAKAFQYLAFF